MKFLLCLVFLAALICFCAKPKKHSGDKLIILKNSQVQVGVVPDLGGRVVMLKKPGMQNIFESDSLFWNDADVRPEPSPTSGFIPFNGHIVWLGPQSEWWIKQDVNQERLDAKAIWPPDPYLTYGIYEVTDQTETSILMRGPESPVSGIQLKKKLSFDQDGIVTFQVSAKNIREQTVAWGIWMNTRLNGQDRCYVPAHKEGLLRLAEDESGQNIPIPFEFVDGYFTFKAVTPTDSSEKWVQKAFINPSSNFIIGFSDKQMLKIGFEHVDRDQIHPDQAPVEIYNMLSLKSSLLELEVHGPYTTLEPGQEIHFSETWELFEYYDKNDPERHIRFIKENVKGKN